MLKLLIVDDTRSVHAFLKRLLPQATFAITDVYDGLEAVNLVHSDKDFDLILLDWEMPKMDGPTVISELKKSDIATPIIMMTTKNQPSEIERMIRAGVSEYLMKPFTQDILLDKIESVTGVSVPRAA